MEFHYRIREGLRPGLLARMRGAAEITDAVAMELCLTSPKSRRLLPRKDLARVSSTILRELAGRRRVRLLFRYDRRKVRKALLAVGGEPGRDGRWLWLDVTKCAPAELVRIVQAVTFTTFYVQVGGDDQIPRTPTLFFGNLRQVDCLVVFTLYDESVEILSAALSAHTMFDAVRRVAAQEEIRLVDASEA